MNSVIIEAQPDFSPRTMQEAMEFAKTLADSDMVPKDYKGKPGNCLIAMQWGNEIGLKPLQSLQGIAVINGRPSIWGDALLALVLTSPACKDINEYYEGTGEEYAAVCIAKRHGRDDVVSRFAVKDARAAGLMGKQGPWTQYRDRMLKMRARGFALRDQFADVLKGMAIAEESLDIEERDITPAKQTPAQIGAASLPQADTTEIADFSSLIADLELVAREDGAEKFKTEWKGLSLEAKAAIGIPERDRILSLAKENGATFDESAETGA